MSSPSDNTDYGQYDISFFYPSLLDNKETKDAFIEELGDEAEALLIKAKNEELTRSEEAVVHDTLLDLILNNGNSVVIITGYGSEDEFDINVMKFGAIFWINAIEFDDIGYFRNEDKAVENIEISYDSFLVKPEL